MQLGTRWQAGMTPPARVPEALHAAIAETEAKAGAERAFWTLTWLEGRPIAELDAGWEVLLGADGVVIARPWQD